MLDCNPYPNPPAAVIAKTVEEENASRMLLITGPEGSGKSRYADDIARALIARGTEAEVFGYATADPYFVAEWFDMFDTDAVRAARRLSHDVPLFAVIIETRLGADEFCDRAARGDAEAAALLRRRLRVYEMPRRSNSPIE